ncbi:MAG: thiamine pyrophosphate-binding protein [Chitinophagales bacterium]|nr:thiamine pyrophosphate-binding protein [Chitinophagales bacterium]
MNGGQIIAKVLQQQGVKFLFTLCGGHISPIFVAAEQCGIRVIDTRHEVNAVFAADAVSRLTGVPGVAAVTAGPGVTNTITAIKNAALAQSPLILLGGAAATILKGRGSLQDINQLSVMKAVCKWSTTISKVKDIVPTIEEAFRRAQTGVPGPVFVECPIDTLYDEELVRSWYGAKSKEEPPRNLQERLVQWYINFHAKRIFADKDTVSFGNAIPKPWFPQHTASDVANATQMLRAAKKPLLIIGSGAIMQAEKAQLLAAAVSKLGIPVYLSGMARGLLGKDNPLQMRHQRKEAIKNSDLIMLAGVPNDFRLDYGNHIGGRKFISINRSKEDLYKNKKPSLPILADPQDFLIALAHAYNANTNEWCRFLAEINAKREQSIEEKANAPVNVGLNPIALLKNLDAALDDNSILIADGGDFVATAAYTLRPRAPLSWLDPGVFGTLGVGAGFALGAKLVYPEKNVWIIYGDGSAGYSLMEYDTFKRLNLPVVSVIGNDACWSQIARDQVEFLKSDCAMNLAYSDYELIAKAFGGDGTRADTMETWQQAVKDAKASIAAGKPYIINAIIGKTDFRKGSISV